MRWRKSYTIHNWFVYNIQDGIDNYAKYVVSHKDIEELMDTCKNVLNGELNAEIALPIDEHENIDWILADLKDIVEQFEEILKDENIDWFEYHSG